MIGTESKLWDALKRYEGRFQSLHRVESPITPGCVDVEYVSEYMSGWVELKTASPPRKGKQFTLHSPFTTAQSAWLVSHHNPDTNVGSYLLLGVLGPRTWSKFLLLVPQTAVLLVQGWKGVTHEELEARPGVLVTTAMEQVADMIAGGPLLEREVV